MSFQENSSVLSKDIADCKIQRPTANYHPSIWGDRFLKYNIDDSSAQELRKEQIEELKEVVRREVFIIAKVDPPHQLRLIDAVQRLGLSYHFETDIDEALQHIHDTYGGDDEKLCDAALRFRLLRQHGYNVSCETFNRFKDERGKFKECLVSDVYGMLSLYEASHLMVQGEETLDEALSFTITHIESLATENSDPSLSYEITCALKRPLRKSLERLQAVHYISIYQNKALHDKSLLDLAKLDFNLVQYLHRKELSEISWWWKDLDVEHKLPFARDRIVELYVWIMGVYFEPKYSSARKFLTKVIAMASLIDDTYDAYGTFEELELFTEAIQRWDVKCLDQLPEYMQLFYRTTLNVYKEFEEDMEEEEKYRVHYAREGMKNVVRAYFEEAKWLHQAYTPSLDEYLQVSLVSTCYPMLATASFVGMGDSVITKDVFEWMVNDPKIVRASTIVCRLMDDIVSHKFERKRDHIPSGIECYIERYEVSEQEACDEFNRQIVNAWKDINQEFLKPTVMPRPVLMRVLNFTRVMDFLYKEDDGYTRVGKVVKDAVAALLIDPMP